MQQSHTGIRGIFQTGKSPKSPTLPFASDDEPDIRQEEEHGEGSVRGSKKITPEEISELLDSLFEKAEEQESRINAVHDLQQQVLERIITISEHVEVLGSTQMTEESLQKAIKPLIKSLEEIKGTLQVMKAVPTMSSAPKRTKDVAEKAKEAGPSHDIKPDEREARANIQSDTVSLLRERIRTKQRANQQMARVDTA
jgi:hypothetical protein